MVNVALGFAAVQIPTDMLGNSAGILTPVNGAFSLPTEFGCTIVGASTAVAGSLIFTTTGYWAVCTAPAVGTVYTVERWFKAGSPNLTSRESIPPTGGTAGIWPASIFASARGGLWIKRANFIGVAASTLVVRNVAQTQASSGGQSIPSTNTGANAFDYGRGIFVNGPCTIVPSAAGIIGHLEIEPA